MAKTSPVDNPYRSRAISKKKGKTKLLELAERVEASVFQLKDRGGNMSHGELLALWRERIKSFWRLHPEAYDLLSDRFLRIGDVFSAVDCSKEGMKLFSDRPQLVYCCALGLARMGARHQAESLLMRHEALLATLPDYRPLIARLHKDAWIATRDGNSLRKARDAYATAAAEPREDVYYPAVNAATLSRFMGDVESAEYYGMLVRKDLEGPQEMNYWKLASLAEAELCAGKLEAARDAYRRAVATGPSPEQLATTRDQASLLLNEIGISKDELADVLGRTLIVCIAGHIVDAENKGKPGFSESRIESAAGGLRRFLEEIEPTAAIGSAAGSDLLAFSILREMGAAPTVILPLESAKNFETSVSASGSDWGNMFDDIVSVAGRVLEVPTESAGRDGQVWMFGNALILGCARQQVSDARGEWELVAIWDGKVGDCNGRTNDMVSRARFLGAKVSVIDPFTGEYKALESEFENTAIPALSCEWVVQIEGSSKNALWICLEAIEIDGVSPMAEIVRLGAQARYIFKSIEACVKCLSSLVKSEGIEACGVGISVGPTAEGDGLMNEPRFYEDAAILAKAALLTPSFLSTWECASIAALSDGLEVSFEFAGQMEFEAKRIMPFYTAVTVTRQLPELKTI